VFRQIDLVVQNADDQNVVILYQMDDVVLGVVMYPHRRCVFKAL
jgi:hypothetical protein|tara:strand:+ start:1290 stop:1421 length:132 start_codon:yes stop_codon:yes gene_type:complete